MDKVGQATLEALQQMFPDRGIEARERDYGNILGITCRVGERRFVWETPADADYRRHAPSWWIHRFSTAIREKTQ